MNQTINYALNQWDAADRILREDFNADNSKIDAALAAIKESAFKIITGSFAGTGVKGTRTYSIGVKPKLLFVRTDHVNPSYTHDKGLMVIENMCITFRSTGGAFMEAIGNPCTLTEDGFTIVHDDTTNGLDDAGSTLYYWAIY